ncbi:trypsin-like peptidase domain-containing protein [Lentzea sp. NPDC058436]|uniref:trypsin-like peptidase domain-containing protein n=1 Tax=Lentzea sp. NPDC058436 TaxID=3346499 RepID=UPI003646C837
MTAQHLDRLRVAQLIVTRAGEGSRGSGYRIRSGAVLTAAHVVDGADSVTVKFAPGLPEEWTVPATSWWSDPVSDIAVLTIEPRHDDVVPPVRFGSINDRAAVLPVVAVGFPLWKMRTDSRTYRDSAHAVGKVPVFSNWRERTLEVVVEGPPRARDDERSPWEGMSGAVLWSDDHVVGVIVKHHPGDGLERLAAARLDLALDQVDPSRGTTLSEVLEARAPFPGVPGESRRERLSGSYWSEVRETAPEHLHDRKREIDELVRFCAGSEPCAWWQAGPWAGKSALLAWFALHPPENVDVVAFFVKARRVGDSDSNAFIEEVVLQLTEMVDASFEPVRSVHRNMLNLLETAAKERHERGRTLLLVVDGLDEDTSRKDGLERPSIASLLPQRSKLGLRVLVASRPHPDLPPDVDAGHPLRRVEPRQLTPSPYASDLRTAAYQELYFLLGNEGVQRELLALITASGGGLTQRDLRELLGQSRYALTVLLGSMVGRSVGASASRDQDEPVYTFTHDTLREQAEKWLEGEIAEHRAKVHAWADSYRDRDWPEDTPLYLFRGYPSLLAARGDVDRLVACALDRLRHDRMLAVTGGDGLAMSEIASVAGLLARAPEPDLDRLVRVAVARSRLSGRNLNIPDALPPLWARLGHTDRAVALAESFSGGLRTEALVRIIEELQARGEHDRIAVLADDVERSVDLTTYSFGQPYSVMIRFARMLLEGAEDERARRVISGLEALVELIDVPYERDNVLGDLVRLAFDEGEHEHALELLATMSADYRRDAVVASLPLAGEHELGLRYAECLKESYQFEEVLWSLAHEARSDPELALRLLRHADDRFGYRYKTNDRLRTLAVDALDAGDDGRALRYALDADDPDDLLGELFERLDGIDRRARIAEALTGPEVVVGVLARLASDCVGAGEPLRAAEFVAVGETLVSQIKRPHDQAVALVRLAAAVSDLGEQGRAGQLHLAAHERVDQIRTAVSKARAFTAMAAVAAECGDAARYTESADLAEEILIGLPWSAGSYFDGIVDLAETAARAVDDARARRLVERASSLVESHVSQDMRLRYDVPLINVAAAIGAPHLVPALLASNPRSVWIRAVLEAALAADDVERADQVVAVWARRAATLDLMEQLVVLVELGEDEAALEVYAGSTDSTYLKNRYLVVAAEAVAAEGDDDRALRLIAALSGSYDRNRTCGEIVEVLAESGQFDRAALYLEAAEKGYHRSGVLRTLARAAANSGDHDRALGFLGQVPNPQVRAIGIVELARTVAEAGDVRRAVALCAAAEECARSDAATRTAGKVFVQLANVLGSAGDYTRAEQLARSDAHDVPQEQALSGLARRVLRRGDAARARELAAEAASVKREDRAYWRYMPLLDLLARTGAVEAAEQVVDEIESVLAASSADYEYKQLFVVYVEALAVVGRCAEAFEHIGELDRGRDRYAALAAIARNAPEGPTLARARAEIMVLMVNYQAEPERYEGGYLVGALAAIGEFDRMLELVDTVQEPGVLADVVRVVAGEATAQKPAQASEWLARCEAAAATSTDTFYRDMTLKDVAVARDALGEHGDAVRLVGLIADSVLRENLLRDFRMKAVVDGRETEAARRHVAEVLASKGWTAALEAVGKVDLGVLQRLADEVLG